MFTFDKRQVTISLKYLGGHPELPKQRNLTAFRANDSIHFKEVNRPVIPVPSIKNITIRKIDCGSGTPKVVLADREIIKNISLKDKIAKNILVITVDYSGLNVHMVFSGNNITAKYAQFMGLLRGNYKEYVTNG